LNPLREEEEGEGVVERKRDALIRGVFSSFYRERVTWKYG